MTTEAVQTFEEIAGREERFQLATYKKMPVAAARGRGAWIETSEGVRYLDLYGGHAVAATGHCHPHVVAAIREQAGTLMHVSNLFFNEPMLRLAARLVERSFASNVYFANSGAACRTPAIDWIGSSITAATDSSASAATDSIEPNSARRWPGTFGRPRSRYLPRNVALIESAVRP